MESNTPLSFKRQMKSRVKVTPIDILQMVANGKSLQEVAKELDILKTTMSQKLSRYYRANKYRGLAHAIAAGFRGKHLR